METEALVLLDGDREAQRLVAVWPRVGAREHSDETELHADWSRASGVFVEDVEKLAPVLFQSEIVGPLGYVAPEALDFIRSQLASKLKARS